MIEGETMPEVEMAAAQKVSLLATASPSCGGHATHRARGGWRAHCLQGKQTESIAESSSLRLRSVTSAVWRVAGFFV